MSTIFDDYERELVEVARRRAGAAPARPSRIYQLRRTTGRAGRALPALAVVAVISLHGAGGTPAARRATVTPAARGLTGELAILRRPQTAADRTELRRPGLPAFLGVPASACHLSGATTPAGCQRTLLRSLVRRVELPRSPDGMTVGIFPQLAGGASTGVVDLTLHSRSVYYASTSSAGAGHAASASTIATRGLLLSAAVGANRDEGAILVPDGVARVSLGDVELTRLEIAGRPDALTPGIAASTTAVADNIAGFSLLGTSVKDLGLDPGEIKNDVSTTSSHGCGPVHAVYALAATAQMRWSAAGGRTLAQRRIPLTIYAAATVPEQEIRVSPGRAAACGRTSGSGPSNGVGHGTITIG